MELNAIFGIVLVALIAGAAIWLRLHKRSLYAVWRADYAGK